jgi:hypothetical protein
MIGIWPWPVTGIALLYLDFYTFILTQFNLDILDIEVLYIYILHCHIFQSDVCSVKYLTQDIYLKMAVHCRTHKNVNWAVETTFCISVAPLTFSSQNAHIHALKGVVVISKVHIFVHATSGVPRQSHIVKCNVHTVLLLLAALSVHRLLRCIV